jgi:hypothetical protein
MFDILDDPFADLSTTRTVLVELKYAFYLKRADIRRSFPSLAFAARVIVDSRTALLRSLDDLCFERIREATKYSMESRYSFTDYEVDRYVVWNGLDDAKLPLSTLSDQEFKTQLEVMETRGYQDRIRVHMAIEVDVHGRCTSNDDKESNDGKLKMTLVIAHKTDTCIGSIESVESRGSIVTIGTVDTVKAID